MLNGQLVNTLLLPNQEHNVVSVQHREPTSVDFLLVLQIKNMQAL